jgi:hypothetical protein
VQQGLFLALDFGRPQLNWKGIMDNNNDKVGDNKDIKLTRGRMVGDDEDDSNSGGDGGKGRCGKEETMEATAEETSEKMALAKATAALIAEVMVGATATSTADNAKVEVIVT